MRVASKEVRVLTCVSAFAPLQSLSLNDEKQGREKALIQALQRARARGPVPAADVPAAAVALAPDTAWQLFTHALTPAQARPLARITGDEWLGVAALQLVAVMA